MGFVSNDQPNECGHYQTLGNNQAHQPNFQPYNHQQKTRVHSADSGREIRQTQRVFVIGFRPESMRAIVRQATAERNRLSN